MTYSIKKITLVLFVTICLFGLTSCGSDKQSVDVEKTPGVDESIADSIVETEPETTKKVEPPIVSYNYSEEELNLPDSSGRFEKVIVEKLEIKESIGDEILGVLHLGDSIEVIKDSGTAYEIVMVDGKEGMVQTKFITRKLFDDNPQDFIFPDSYKRYLTGDDINQLENEESVRIAINEIYARRGRIFNSDDLNERFLSTEWYEAVTPPEEFDSNQDFYLNDYERENILLLDTYRNDTFVNVGPDETEEDFVATGLSEAEIRQQLYDETMDVDLSQYCGRYICYANRTPIVDIIIDQNAGFHDRAHLFYQYIDPYGDGSGFAEGDFDKLNFGNTNILGIGFAKEKDPVPGGYSATLFITFEEEKITFVYYIRDNSLVCGAYPRKSVSGVLQKVE